MSGSPCRMSGIGAWFGRTPARHHIVTAWLHEVRGRVLRLAREERWYLRCCDLRVFDEAGAAQVVGPGSCTTAPPANPARQSLKGLVWRVAGLCSNPDMAGPPRSRRAMKSAAGSVRWMAALQKRSTGFTSGDCSAIWTPPIHFVGPELGAQVRSSLVLACKEDAPLPCYLPQSGDWYSTPEEGATCCSPVPSA